MRVSGGAVASRVRADARRSWRSWVVLGLLIGLAAGSVMAAVATARRTESTFRRFADDTRAPTIAIGLTCAAERTACPPTAEVVEQLRSAPGVLDVAPAMHGGGPVLDEDGELLQPNGDPCASSIGTIGVVSGLDRTLWNDVLGLRMVEGRRADPSRADEATISPLIARQQGVEVGDRVRAHVGAGVLCEDPSTWGEGHELTVVGIGFTALEIPAKAGAQYLQNLHTTPAFAEQVPDLSFSTFLVVLEEGSTANDLRAIDGFPEFEVRLELADFADPIEDGLSSDANALWLFALVAAVASVCVIGPATSRHRWVIAEQDRQLAAIGWARGERLARSAVHALAIWGVAAAVAATVVVAASTRSPVGDASTIEPPSTHEVDGRVLAVGLLSLAVVVEATLVLPAMAMRTRRERNRRTPLAGWAADVGLGPAAVMGVRVGIEPDRQQVPARTAVLAAAVGVATVTGVLVYTASAQHLRETAAERGVVWDELVYVADQDRPIELAGVVREWAEVDEVGPALYFTMGLVMGPDERETRVMAFGGAPADIEPRVISGRAPAGDAEVALNPKLAADLAVAVGDTIDVSLSTLGVPPDEAELLRAVPARAFEVVGTAAVPLGDGFFGSACAMTIDGYLTLLPDVLREEYAGQADFLMIRRGDDVGADALVTRLAEIDVDHEPLDPLVAEDVLDNILSVDRTGTESVPDLLGWLMLVTGTGVLTYGVVMTLSRNRRELAIVRAVGFDRRLLRRTSRCVGLVQGTAALTLGLPLGVIAGRYAWHLYARSLGVAEIEHVPVVELAALVGATLLFGVLVASLAGRWVGRRSVGAVLRTVE